MGSISALQLKAAQSVHLYGKSAIVGLGMWLSGQKAGCTSIRIWVWMLGTHKKMVIAAVCVSCTRWPAQWATGGQVTSWSSQASLSMFSERSCVGKQAGKSSMSNAQGLFLASTLTITHPHINTTYTQEWIKLGDSVLRASLLLTTVSRSRRSKLACSVFLSQLSPLCSLHLDCVLT